MNRIFFVVLMVIIFTGSLFAQTEGVINVIPIPQYPYGVAHDGTNIWVGTSSSNSNQIWKLDPADGTVLGSINVPYQPSGSYTVRALASDGDYLWVFMDLPSADHPDKFYKVDPSTGNVLKTINSPINNYIGGMDYFDGHIWFSSYYSSSPSQNNALIQMDTTGAIVNSFNTEYEQPMGVAYDGRFVWCAEDTGSSFGSTRQEIFKYDPASLTYTGEKIRNPDNSPRDMAYFGGYFWLVGYYTQQVYQIDPVGGTPTINLSASNLNFGLVATGNLGERTVVFMNDGNAPLQIDSIKFSNAAYSTGVSTPFTVDPSSSQSVKFVFEPPAYGMYPGTITVYHNDPTEPPVVVTVQGTGLYPDATIGFNQTTHNFGNVWVAEEGVASWKMQVINRGFQTLVVDSFSTGSPVFGMSAPLFPFTVSADDTVISTVYFNPPQAAVYQDTLKIFSNDSGNPVSEIIISGTGVKDNYSSGYQFWNFNVPGNPVAGSYQEYEVDGLVAINDINGDGAGEIVIATENYWLLCISGASSGTADTLWSFSTYISNYSAGSIGANLDYGVQDAIDVAPDLNGDGYNDIVIATGGGNEHVYAIDGTNGQKLWEYGTDDQNSYGLGDFEAVDVKKDFTGDGVNDVLAIADGNEQGTGYKSAYLFNGATGVKIWSYQYPGPNLSFGKTIISLEDVNSDNVPDAAIAVGNNGDTDLKVYGLDGATGFPLWDYAVTTWEPKELLELPVEGQTPDIIACEYFDTVYRLDGESGTKIWSALLPGSLSGVIQMDLINDANGDGKPDVLVASFAYGLICLDGETGANLWAYTMRNQYGVTSVPDLNNDGIDDVFAGDGENDGSVYAISGAGDSLFFTYTFAGTRVISVDAMPSIDGNTSWELVAGTRDGQVVCFSGGLRAANDISYPDGSILNRFALLPNYPNPFNPNTTLQFMLGISGEVNLYVYNLAGQKVAEILKGKWLPAGRNYVQFDASGLASGTYFYRLQSTEGVLNGKMVLIK